MASEAALSGIALAGAPRVDDAGVGVPVLHDRDVLIADDVLGVRTLLGRCYRERLSGSGGLGGSRGLDVIRR